MADDDGVAEAAERNRSGEDRSWLIIVGASAGGIEALSALLGALPDKLDAALVVVLHLVENQRTLLAELLNRETRWPVLPLQESGRLEAGQVALVPAGHDLLVEERDGSWFARLEPVAPERGHPHSPSLDRLFSSPPTPVASHVIAIILSGSGRDGCDGLRQLRAAGGAVLVQDPDEARHSTMPTAAIDAAVANQVLTVNLLAREVVRMIQRPFAAGYSASSPGEGLGIVVDEIKRVTGVDFSGYRSATLLRRLEHRFRTSGESDFGRYMQQLAGSAGELDALARELLVGVTAFLRDRGLFERLEQLIDERLANGVGKEHFRVWVAGCATGEEAYTLAMMINERLLRMRAPPLLQLFATDVDPAALAQARAATYDEERISPLPTRWRERYLTWRNGRYEIVRSLRERVVFARHDLLGNPPFIHIDLVSCRNLLIYLDEDHQRKVIERLHAALDMGGLLFLGPSEQIPVGQSLFAPIDQKAHIYTRLPGAPRRMQSDHAGELKVTSANGSIYSRGDSLDRFRDLVLTHLAPPSLLVDESWRVLHTIGAVGDLLNFPKPGSPFDLFSLVPFELREELERLLDLATRGGKRVEGQEIRLFSSPLRAVKLVVLPQAGNGYRRYLVGMNLRLVGNGLASESAAEVVEDELQDELNRMREQLGVTEAELNFVQRQSDALNLEVDTINDQLRAANQALESTNHELELSNRELLLLMDQMVERSVDWVALNAEYAQVRDSLDFALLVVDHDGLLRRCNQLAREWFTLPATGRPIDFTLFDKVYQGIGEDLQRVNSDPVVIERLYEGGAWAALVRMVPWIGGDGAHAGVVLVVIDHTEKVRARKRLQASRQRLETLMDHNWLMVLVSSSVGEVEYANQHLCKFFGLADDQIRGSQIQQLFAGNRFGQQLCDNHQQVAETHGTIEWETVTDDHEGNNRSLRLVQFAFAGEEGYSICCQIEDVTARRHAEEQLRLAAKVFDRDGEGVSITDARGVILTVNDAFTRVTGYSREEVIGSTPGLLKSGRHSSDFYKQMWRDLRRNGKWQGEIWNRRKSGDIYLEWLTINQVYDERGEVSNYVGIFTDITAIKDSERRVAYLATHDVLTGLPNRALFIDELRQATIRARRHDHQLVVMFLDLDNFKVINDTLGHESGDQLLRQASKRIQASVREEDLVARLGGDEFTVILNEAGPAEAKQIARRIIETLASLFRIDDNDLYVSASIGISLFPHDGTDDSTLLKCADTAMYRAKSLGKNNYQFFTEEMKQMAERRLQIETGLRDGLDEGRFSLHLQPKIAVEGGELVGAEALLRWSDPRLGQVSPAEFIPIAEEAGLIIPITQWVISRVCSLISRWRSAGLMVPPISLNLSPNHFYSGHVADDLLRIMAQYGIESQQLVLELTEGTLMGKQGHILEEMNRLHEAGFCLSIDDFGTGYSSLSYLNRYPICELKIDRAFIDNIDRDESASSISRAILAMADALGLKSVAEGVENESQLAVLRSYGCHTFQGYFAYRPLPVEEFMALLPMVKTEES